jgi:hypothetical protein
VNQRKFPWAALGAAALLCVLGAVAVVVTLQSVIPAEKLRAWALENARRNLGREVRFNSIGLGFRGVTLDGLEISEAPDFSVGTFVKIHHVRLRPSWKALLRRRLVVAAVEAEGLDVQLVRDATGRFNFESSRPASSAALGASGTASSADFDVRRAVVRKARVRFSDLSDGRVWNVSVLDATLSDIGYSRPFHVDAAGRLQGTSGKRTIDADFELEGKIDLSKGLGPGFRADVERLVVAQDSLRVLVRGRVAGLSPTRADFEADASIQGRQVLRVQGKTNVGDDVAAEIRAVSQAQDTRALARWLPGASIPALRLPEMKATASIVATKSTFTLKSFLAEWTGGKVTASGVVNNISSSAPDVQVQIAAGISLPELKAADLPMSWKAVPSGTRLPATRIDGNINLTGADVLLRQVVLQSNQSSLKVEGKIVDAFGGNARSDLAIQVDLKLPELNREDMPYLALPKTVSVPAARWTGEIDVAPSLWKFKSLRARTAASDLEISGSVIDPHARGALDLLLKTHALSLDELGHSAADLRPWKLGGGGLLALAVTGTLEKPLFAGKFAAQDMAAEISGLPLSRLNGTITFDDRRVDVQGLTGIMDESQLKLDLTVKDFSRAPDVEIEATLDHFDLGRYLKAKSKFIADRRGAAQAQSTPETKPTPINTRGHISIASLVHPTASVRDVKVGWSLRGLTPDFKSLGGDATLRVGEGRLRDIGDIATQSPLAKVLLLPILITQKLGRIGGLSRIPDFNDIAVEQIVGDYSFREGRMTLTRSELSSNVADAAAKGTIDLPSEILDVIMTITVHAYNIQPVEVAVTGPLSKPITKVNVLKFLQGILVR